MSCENKHIILETDDDKLVECTLQWINMCNKNVQRKIKERVVEKEAKEEEEEEEGGEEEEEIDVEEEQQDTQEPHVPPGSSSEKEEPVPPERSSEKEESGGRKTDIKNDETAPEEKPATRLFYGQDITGNEDDSVFRELKDCLQMVTMVSGQDSITKDIQRLRNIDICWLFIKATGTTSQMTS